jgi:putative hydrolase of the HAD superfamily
MDIVFSGKNSNSGTVFCHQHGRLVKGCFSGFIRPTIQFIRTMKMLSESANYLTRLLITHRQEFLELIRSHSRPLHPLPTDVPPRREYSGDVRAVLFDVYGTLLVSSRGEVGSGAPGDGDEAAADTGMGPCVAALRRAGYTAHQEAEERTQELYRQLIEESHAADRALGIQHPEVDILSIWERILHRLSAEHMIDRGPEPYGVVMAALVFELRTNMVWPMPGAMEVLRELRRRGLLLGIVSNAQFYTPLMIEALFGQTLEELGFTAAVWSYLEREAKPSFRLFSRFFARLNEDAQLHPRDEREEIGPGNSVYIGNDMLNDIYAAREAGLRTVLFAGDRRSLRLRKENGIPDLIEPDAVCTDLHQLLDIVTLNPG